MVSWSNPSTLGELRDAAQARCWGSRVETNGYGGRSRDWRCPRRSGKPRRAGRAYRSVARRRRVSRGSPRWPVPGRRLRRRGAERGKGDSRRVKSVTGPKLTRRQTDRGLADHAGQRAIRGDPGSSPRRAPVEPAVALSTTRPLMVVLMGGSFELTAAGRDLWDASTSSFNAASRTRPLKMREVDGKAWIVSARTSIGTRALIASTHSWMAAEASGQAIAAPTSRRGAAIDFDRDVPDFRFIDGIALRGLRVSATNSNASRPRSSALEVVTPPRRLLGSVGRPGQRAVVGHHGLAERHPDRDLALVVGLVGVQLGSRRVADDPQAVRHAQPPVARERRPPGRVDAVVLEPEILDRERAPDREQDDMTLGGRAVIELDDVGAVLPGRCPRPRAVPGRRSGPSRRRPRAWRAGPRNCAGGRSARGGARTGRSSSGPRSGRRPGPARSRSGRHRGRAGCAAARGSGSPPRWST